MRRLPVLAAALALALGVFAAPKFLVSRINAGNDYVNFESPHVHPLALTPDGNTLVAVNTPGGSISVFDLTGTVPVRTKVIPVGIEPVAVAARTNDEVWVVNHVSDDVSVVDLTSGNVRATLRVGDEPNDVVFAGSPLEAYVSVGQEDAVKIYDPSSLGTPPIVVPTVGRKPRTLVTNAARTKVFVAIYESGNRTSIVPAALVGANMPTPDPPRNPALGPAPEVGLIVQQQGPAGSPSWVDNSLQNWNAQMPFNLPDVDVQEIDVASHTISRTLGGVASNIFGLAVSPIDGKLAIVGSEARNLIRFEPKLHGYLVETRLRFWSATGIVTQRILNPHINYDLLPAAPGEADSALGQPMDLEYSPDGACFYVACLSTDKIGVVTPSGFIAARIPVGGGPSGVKVDGPRNRLYVLDRYRNQLETLDRTTFTQTAIANIGYDPTPDDVVNGRRHFYAGLTSGHGDQSCNSCHLFGDTDQLAWDLGNPPGNVVPPPAGQPDTALTGFDPMKGPIVTQTLVGIAGTEPFHWRGDREDLGAFKPAFETLMGLPPDAFPDTSMIAFTHFVASIKYAPNPFMNLDRTQRNTGVIPSPASGESLFLNRPIQGTQRCVDCHATPEGTNRLLVNKTTLQESQDMKVPQLRNLYEKTGFTRSAGTAQRGFGYTHDGSVESIFDFLHSTRFSFTAGPEGDDERRNVEAFLLAFDTGMSPAVGYQITFDGANNNDAGLIATLDTLVTQADQSQCDLIAKGVVAGQARGWVYVGGGNLQWDRYADGMISVAALRGLATAGGEITVSGVPKGSGVRMGIDRDRDGIFDRDELDMSADPDDPTSPGVVAVGPGSNKRFGLQMVKPNPFSAHTEVLFALRAAGPVDLRVYDVLGRELRTVARGIWMEPGPHSLAWDGRGSEGREAPAGLYFMRLKIDGRVESRPVVKLR